MTYSWRPASFSERTALCRPRQERREDAELGERWRSSPVPGEALWLRNRERPRHWRAGSRRHAARGSNGASMTGPRGRRRRAGQSRDRESSFPELVRRAGPPSITFNGPRHSYLTHLLRANVHPKIASERAGHSSVAVTMDIYSHIVPTMQQDAADRLTPRSAELSKVEGLRCQSGANSEFVRSGVSANYLISRTWRGAGVVERGGLENRCVLCAPWVRIPPPPPGSLPRCARRSH